MNLHRIVSGVIAGVNPFLPVVVRQSTGNTPSPAGDGTRVPSYAAPVQISAQIQPAPMSMLRQIEGLNLQGTHKTLYTNGAINGEVRIELKGGDLITLPGGGVWLVVAVPEAWNITAGWTRALITLQNGS